ncbi:MAG: hypothetical protein C5B51_07410 [Terriglobia bacterium]|nr:MAG: hypothetical protein C5B51_07410 [Terriglobia bacterium]
MRIFMAYGYNDRDKWVEQHIIPLVTAFGCDVVHGKAVFGGALPDEVMKLIRTSDAVLGFTTRRDLIAPGQYRTHDWVVQELLTAHTQDPPIPWVEIREEGVISPGGVLEFANAQRIDYREEDRTGCLVKIAEALKRFRDISNVTTIRLGPSAAVEQISSLLDDPSFTCNCQTLRGAVQLAPRRTPVFPIKGGLFVQLRGVAPGELVRITISVRGRIWRSDYESVDTVDVQVKE